MLAAFGFRGPDDPGSWARAVVEKLDPGAHRVWLASHAPRGGPMGQGFSGGPVADPGTRLIVGMASLAWAQQPATLMIPVAALAAGRAELRPALLAARPGRPGGRPARRDPPVPGQPRRRVMASATAPGAFAGQEVACAGEFGAVVGGGEHVGVAPAGGGDLAAVVQAVQEGGRDLDAGPLVQPGLGRGVQGAAGRGPGAVPVVVHDGLDELGGLGAAEHGLQVGLVQQQGR